VTRARVADVEYGLGERVDVTTRFTERPGHATELAREAAQSADAVVVYSGDGTYNEAINGAAGQIPFGFLAGGGTSVLPRALGLPRDHVAAARRIGAALAEGRTQSIGLGSVNGRRFCFAAGIGLDAEAVRRIDERGRTADGKRASNVAFVATVARIIVEQRLRFEPELEIDGYGRAAFVFVANGSPYTYAGPFPFAIAGAARFDRGIDFVAPRAVSPRDVPRLLVRGLTGSLGDDRTFVGGHDLDRIDVRCDRPLPLQADGEDLGDVTQATFEAERDAVEVLV
jgi:diacylglycerol kinase family enzyme